MKDKSPRRGSQMKSMDETYKDDSENWRETSIGKVTILVIIGFSLLTILAGGIHSSGEPQTDASPAAPNTTIVSDVNYSTVYAETTPSVVSVYANSVNGTSSQGSGFVYDTDNHIVTNWHVINSADDVYVRYSNGEWTNATVIGSDAYTDLAVLKVESRPESAKPLPVRNSVPRVGEKVIALGSPDNLRGSLTQGAVSGVNRSMTTPQGFVIPDMIQTDASLNPGNSGGPLVGMDGNVIGLNRARQGENLGFAISGRIMNTIIPSLLDDGEHHHSMVGIRGTTMSPTLAQANDVELQAGILVTDVIDGGPSDGVLQGGNGTLEQNGFTAQNGGDLIVAIDGHSITTNEALTSYLMRETAPGDTVEFSIIRNGENRTVSVTLGERPVYGG